MRDRKNDVYATYDYLKETIAYANEAYDLAKNSLFATSLMGSQHHSKKAMEAAKNASSAANDAFDVIEIIIKELKKR